MPAAPAAHVLADTIFNGQTLQEITAVFFFVHCENFTVRVSSVEMAISIRFAAIRVPGQAKAGRRTTREGGRRNLHVVRHGRLETDHVAGERVEYACSVRVLPVREDEQCTVGDNGDNIVLAEHKQVLAEEAATGGVHHEV